ncbi:MAG: hypothetical protein A3J54_02070 [Candidatus Ryanbacteria bacterium RIFCSPHIGHO2_02_FULL_45_13b]|uniref:Glycosyltransferase RgtA/B/C/D-like domain-containing protein n=1 Tax=Candidatus Ryanbacteria bacterium RIFCSPHIGHO2_02_FULL_45_13b TaxID=1802117 RepID=A0A1G2G3N3_9BACT|nr:MAG: hypothetical protein A3J54_02070 [Candidatus Ryanbacteria bacterium RIFCSPHIGHO2_02_FULL_45_13b]
MKHYFSSPIALLVAVVILMSAGYSFYYHDRPRVDAKAYDSIGWNLARGLGYVEHEQNAGNPRGDDAIVRVGPGYQFFLAGVYTLFGHHVWVVWILHALLRGGTVYLVYALTRFFLHNEKPALLAALLVGFSPDLIVINGLLLTETLFLFLLIAAVYGTIRLVSSDISATRLSVVGSGFLWACAVLTRPVALVPLFATVGILLFRRRWRDTVLIVVMPLLLVGSWSYTMTQRYDHFIITTTAGWYDIWVGNNPEATGGFEKSVAIQDFRDVTHDSTVLERVGREKYFEFLFYQPFQFLELQWRKTALYVSSIRPGGYWIHLLAHPWDMRVTLAASLVWTLILFAGGLAGGYRWFRERRDVASRLFLFFAVLQPLAVIPIIVETRYRYAFFPFLAICTAYFIMTYRPKVSLRALGFALVFLGTATLYDLWYNFGDIIEKIGRVL